MEFKAQIDEQKIQEDLDFWLEKQTQELVKGIVEGWGVRESIEKKAKAAIEGSLDCLLFFVGCTVTDPGLPPGYKLLCSAEGKYSLIIPDVPGGRISANVWETAIDAKEFA